MNAMRRIATAAVLLRVSASVFGCASSKSMSSAAGAAPSAVNPAASLLTSLGGMNGVQQLANVFGANLASNPAVTKYLDAAGIEGAKGGLMNSILSASGQAVPSGSQNLLSALSGKGLDAAAVNGVSDALSAAGKTQNLGAAEQSALASLMTPVTQSLLGGK